MFAFWPKCHRPSSVIERSRLEWEERKTSTMVLQEGGGGEGLCLHSQEGQDLCACAAAEELIFNTSSEHQIRAWRRISERLSCSFYKHTCTFPRVASCHSHWELGTFEEFVSSFWFYYTRSWRNLTKWLADSTKEISASISLLSRFCWSSLPPRLFVASVKSEGLCWCRCQTTKHIKNSLAQDLGQTLWVNSTDRAVRVYFTHAVPAGLYVCIWLYILMCAAFWADNWRNKGCVYWARHRRGQGHPQLYSSVYLNDNAFVEAILYEKKNGYFSFFLFSEERMLFYALKTCVFWWKSYLW